MSTQTYLDYSRVVHRDVMKKERTGIAALDPDAPLTAFLSMELTSIQSQSISQKTQDNSPDTRYFLTFFIFNPSSLEWDRRGLAFDSASDPKIIIVKEELLATYAKYLDQNE